MTIFLLKFARLLSLLKSNLNKSKRSIVVIKLEQNDLKDFKSFQICEYLEDISTEKHTVT